MNKKQKIVLWLGIFTIVLMCLFPPWVFIMKGEDSLVDAKVLKYLPKNITIKPYYRFILKPPSPSVLDLDFPFYCSVNPPYIAFFIKDSFPDWFSKRSVQNAFIDTHLLTIECVIVALITVGLLCTFTTKEKYKHKEQKVEIRK